ncbi:MAG TPA: penicillin-binding transpeptidase domain-containing protein, partial [Chondromyces sp.]|nr:penicillin-binding transpeptidase domain-containing protein [Chondromyces sp.]
GKTGTAELKSSQGEAGKENGLFVVYDQQTPSFVLATMVEGIEAEGGSKVVVELSREILLKWKDHRNS